MKELKHHVPDESTLTSRGALNVAEVAAAVSPVKLEAPVPAIVVIIPVDTIILRMR